MFREYISRVFRRLRERPRSNRCLVSYSRNEVSREGAARFRGRTLFRERDAGFERDRFRVPPS